MFRSQLSRLAPSLRAATSLRPSLLPTTPLRSSHRMPNGATFAGKHAKVDPTAFVAFNATLVGEVHLAPRSSVYYQAVVRADNTPIRIGEDSNIQDGAVLHSDPGAPLIVGAGVTVGHKAILHGCVLEDNVLIGMGATVMNNAVVGRDSIVGAGALVTANTKIPPGSLVVGTPAKVIRAAKPEEIEGNKRSAQVYVDKIAEAKAGNPQYYE